MVFTFWGLLVLMELLALSILLIRLPGAKNKLTKTLSVVIFLGVPLLSFMVYQKIGDSKQQMAYWAKQQQTQTPSDNQMIALLQQNLRQHPRSAEGWYLLGHLQLDYGHVQAALNPLAIAHQLAPNNDRYTLSWLEAQFLQQHQQLTRQQSQLLQLLVRHSPNNSEALSLLALDAYHHHRKQQAMVYWHQLLSMFPQSSEQHRHILQLLSHASN